MQARSSCLAFQEAGALSPCGYQKDGHHLEDEDESGMRVSTYRSKVFKSPTSRASGTLPTRFILDCVQRAPDDIQWEVDKREFDAVMVTKNLLLGLMGFRIVSVGVRVGWDLYSCLL